MSDRYARQRLLAAVGERGQQRIASASYIVNDAALAGAQVERDYLVRAGAVRFEPSSHPAAPFAHAAAFSNAAARDFAEGAWRALTQLKNALNQG